MEEKSKAGLKEQHERRKRINRIKMGIISSIFIWMLVSMIVCVTLLVKVHSLENKLEELSVSAAKTNQVQLLENAVGNSASYDTMGQELESSTGEPTQGTESIVAGVPALDVDTPENLAQQGEPLKVYLTFDDGPSSNTESILDTLAQYNVKATFFVVGREDEHSIEMYKRIVEEGHTLGMHSYSHKYSEIYNSLEGFQTDLAKIQGLLYEATGQECMFYRFPGGSSNQVSNTEMKQFISYLNSQGITYFDWNVSSGDATSQAYTSEDLVENIMQDVVKYKTSVVLMHDSDTKGATVEALSTVLEQLSSVGAQILPIDADTTVVQHIAADSVE